MARGQQDMVKGDDGNYTGPSLTALNNRNLINFFFFLTMKSRETKLSNSKNHVLSNARIFKKPELELISVPIDDPTDYAALWSLVPVIVKNEIAKLGQEANITINLAPGTPAMSTTWDDDGRNR